MSRRCCCGKAEKNRSRLAGSRRRGAGSCRGRPAVLRRPGSDRSASVWAEASPELPYERAAGQDININSADAEALTLLPGIGEALAGRIIRYREENGGFSDISEILSVNGIGQATFDKIKDYITAEDMP